MERNVLISTFFGICKMLLFLRYMLKASEVLISFAIVLLLVHDEETEYRTAMAANVWYPFFDVLSGKSE